MRDQKLILKVFCHNKQFLIRYARGIMDKKMFDSAEVEILVDDVLLNVIKTGENYCDFKDDEHILKYFVTSIRKLSRIRYFIKINKMLKEIPLSEIQLKKQHDLCRNILENNRTIGEIERLQNERKVNTYIFAQKKAP